MQAKWEDAPEWAQWWARDSDGVEWWFETEPFERYPGWWDVRVGERAAPVLTGVAVPVKEPRPT